MSEQGAAPADRLFLPVPAQTVIAAFTTVVVGFGSTILLVVEAARVLGATSAQSASWVAALCFGMAITTLILSIRHRMPVITAWSTPGVVLLATSGGGISFSEAVGAFLFAGFLTCVTAAFEPLTRLIQKIPAPVAAAMLAGVLLRYCLNVPAALTASPLLVAPAVVLYLGFRLWHPMLAMPFAVAGGLGAAILWDAMDPSCCAVGITWLSWTTPELDPAVLIGLGVPLYLVTMASQNLPGFAVLRQAGYEPPVTPALWTTGIASMLLAPFGAHSINMAALTAALCTGEECHPDAKERWRVAQPYLVIYMLLGLFSGTMVEVLAAMPASLITAVAGLGLLSPLMNAAPAMTREPSQLEAAIIAFLVTASGVSVFHVGSAFWGLAAGLLFLGLKGFASSLRGRKE
jgi:benzoate membrane transport protein